MHMNRIIFTLVAIGGLFAIAKQPSGRVFEKRMTGPLYLENVRIPAQKRPEKMPAKMPQNVAIEVTDEALEVCRRYSKLAKSIKRHTRR